MIPTNGKESVVKKNQVMEQVKYCHADSITDDRKLPLHMIQNHNTMLKKKIPPPNHSQMPTCSSYDQ
jgi:hypothetical protein